MAEMTDEFADLAGLESYRVLGTLLADAVQRYGVRPDIVEEKAALEARRAAEQVLFDGVPVSQIESEGSWAKGKMETPGVQFYDYVQILRLTVPSGRGAEALPQIRAYWLSRGMNVALDADSSAGNVLANPGKGEWTLRAGVLDPATVFVRVASGPVLASSSPMESDKES